MPNALIIRQKRLLQITRNAPVLHGKLDDLRDRFAKQHCVVLEKLLEPALLTKIQRHVERAQWKSSAFEGSDHEHMFSGTESTLEEPVTYNLLCFILNNPEFLNMIRIITGYNEISEFSGRVYRMEAGPQHQPSWHNDIEIKEKRVVGLSVNLSTDVFLG